VWGEVKNGWGQDAWVEIPSFLGVNLRRGRRSSG
jgi:hypothetical protein